MYYINAISHAVPTVAELTLKSNQKATVANRMFRYTAGLSQIDISDRCVRHNLR